MAYTPSSLPLFIRIFIDVILYVSACAGLAVLFLLVEPAKRGFFCEDLSIRYPRHADTVTNTHLLLVGALSPIVAIVGIEILFRLFMGRRRSPKDFFLAVLKLVGMYLYGLLICILVTDVLKTCVGRLRPHFIETCKPDFTQINCTDGYITNFECAEDVDHKKLKDARKSFPSGHASLAFYAATYLVIYTEERLEVTFSTLLKSFIQLGLVLLASFCAVSRVTDHRHHTEDVIVGALLGVLVALWLVFWVGRHTRRESPLPRVNRASAWQGGESVVLTDAMNSPELKSPPRSPVRLTERTQALLRPQTPLDVHRE